MVIDIEKGTINGADARYLTDDLCIKAFGKPNDSHKMIPSGKTFKYNNLGLFFNFNDDINSNIKSLSIELDNDVLPVKKFLEVGQLIPDFNGIVTITDIKKQFSKNKIEITESTFIETGFLKIYSNFNSNNILVRYDTISGIVSRCTIYFE